MNTFRSYPRIILVAALAACFAAAHVAFAQDFKFHFGTAKAQRGWTTVSATNLYSTETGYGFEPGANVAAENNSAASDRPFYFSVRVPEGIIFDGNLRGLPWDYAFDEKQGRAISVDSAAILEGLDKIYHAKELVRELRDGKRMQ